MTRKDLEKMINLTFAWDLLGESGSPEEGREELLNVLERLYNQTIDDSISVYMRSSYYTTDKEIKGLEEVLKLKIK